MWGLKEDELLCGYDWKNLRENIKTYSVRNSLGIVLLPTASTSVLCNFVECIEPYVSNIFKRETLTGSFKVINKNLMRDLLGLGLWSYELLTKIFINNGSIQKIDEIPSNIKKIYKTAFEISKKVLIEHAADRAVFVCQSQSMNIFLDRCDFSILSSVLMKGYELGLKTGSYYIRTRPSAHQLSLNIDSKQTIINSINEAKFIKTKMDDVFKTENNNGPINNIDKTLIKKESNNDKRADQSSDKTESLKKT